MGQGQGAPSFIRHFGQQSKVDIRRAQIARVCALTEGHLKVGIKGQAIVFCCDCPACLIQRDFDVAGHGQRCFFAHHR
jgi:hypothetical protein